MKKLTIILILLLSQSLWGAIGSTCTWEVRSTGANTSGGGYTSGGTDYSQQPAPQYDITTATSAGAGNTLLTVAAAAAMVGNVAQTQGGTNITNNEFFEVASVVVGTSITFSTSHSGASIATGIVANGHLHIGGAFLIGGTLDDDFFDSLQAGNTIYLQSTAGGVTYTTGENVGMGSAGTGPLPITFEPYITARGTIPAGTDRPTIAAGANGFYFGQCSLIKNMIFTISHASGIDNGGYGFTFVNCKCTSSGVANSYAFGAGSGNARFINCEAVSPLGYAFAMNAGNSMAINCYAHDSQQGFRITGLNDSIIHCIADTCQTGINCVANGNLLITNNTIRNCITGISGSTSGASYSDTFINNIITDCITGAAWTTEEKINQWDYNCWYNPAGTDVTLVTKGLNDITADPLLVSGLASGTDGATDKLGTTFTAASAPFSGVTTSDCLLISVAGTGMTLGVYIISSVDSTSQLTLSTSAGANKTGATYGLIKGANFTLSAGSPCFDAGMQPGSGIGL